MHSERLTTGFFVLFLIFLGTTIGFGSYALTLFRERGEIASLRNSLLNQETLQRQLTRGSNTLHAIYPHADPRVGFTLNHDMRKSTLWAAEGYEYEINSIGLRGPEIPPKTPGTKRIVLVSDSWFFGWGVRDDQR